MMKSYLKSIGIIIFAFVVAVSAYGVKPSVQKGKSSVGTVDSTKGGGDKGSSNGGKGHGGSTRKGSAGELGAKGKGAGSASLKLPPPPVGVSVETFTVNGVSFEMVRVDGGSFMMGSDDPEGFDEVKPVHRETVGTFWIGRTEVTQALWKAVMGSNPSEFRGAHLPVENVSWDDCQEFIERLNRKTEKKFRLPSEAEWEYAARGGNRSAGYGYSGSNDLNRVAWYDSNNNNKTHSVATKLDNELGLYDMSGNVWEWCQDYYRFNYNASFDYTSRIFRGGCFYNNAPYCRVVSRPDLAPNGSGSRYVGLRLAL